MEAGNAAGYYELCGNHVKLCQVNGVVEICVDSVGRVKLGTLCMTHWLYLLFHIRAQSRQFP